MKKNSKPIPTLLDASEYKQREPDSSQRASGRKEGLLGRPVCPPDFGHGSAAAAV